MKLTFNNECLTTYTDVKGKCSLMFFTYGCNLHCYKCHVYSWLNEDIPRARVADESWVLDKIKEGKDYADCIIFSGGEFLLNNIEDISDFLIRVRDVFPGKIIVNTNGTLPEKMEETSSLVDGFYLDVKAPFWALNGYDEVDRAYFKLIYGIEYSPELILKLKRSLVFLSNREKEYDRTRTVKYPIMPEWMCKNIEDSMKELGLEHDFNPFVTGEEL